MDAEFWSNLFYAITSVYLASKLTDMLFKNKQHHGDIKSMNVETIKMIDVKIEKYDDMYYLFDRKSDLFIAQGKNLEELKKRCDERYKTNVIVADTDDLKANGLT